MAKRERPHYLPTGSYLALNRAVAPIDAGLDSLGTFLVGSCLTRHDYRDVDVRTIMQDEVYDRMFPGGDSGTESDAFWCLLCESIGAMLSRASGLPIDYQIQRMTEANLFHGKRTGTQRNALTASAGNLYPGEWPSYVRTKLKNEQSAVESEPR